MTKLVVTHEVDNVAHWLASPMREQAFAGIVTNITTYVLPGGSNRVALSMDLADMAAFDAVMKSDIAAKAMKHDGVSPDTLVMYNAS
jgi:hypothetical protein